MFELPPEVIAHIFEYDCTHHDHFRANVLPLMKRICLLDAQVFNNLFAIALSQSRMKQFLRRWKKADIRELAHVTRTRLPKRFTKRKGLMRIISRYYIPQK